MGRPGQDQNISVVTVTLQIEDYLGTKVIALNRYWNHNLTAFSKKATLYYSIDFKRAFKMLLSAEP